MLPQHFFVTLLTGAVMTFGGCESPYAARPADDGPPTPEAGADVPLGDGFVVWESHRSGDWRIWIRGLDGSPPRQLTRDEEGGRQHCCPHVAPDGRGLVYLSLPRGDEQYPESGASGTLRFIAADGTGDRVLAGEARTYYEHRAAVWKSPRELVFIDGEGRTSLLDLDGGTRLLTEEGADAHGWLVNSTLTHATAGLPTFSPYDGGRRRIRPGRDLGGCQPYFSHDGRWGYYIAGAGGPVKKVDLATRQVTTMLGKSDPRLPPDQGYVYFPMLSPDGRLFAVGASRDEHSHHTEDYDVFVAETDPSTLEILGPMRRITSDPATDRFPDVYSAPLALGRHFGEAPLTVELDPADGRPEGDDWSFTVDGEEIGRGAAVSHTFELPGTYQVSAERGAEVLVGRATVREARPPVVVGVDLRRGREVIVAFDEEVDASAARLAFASGREIAGWKLRDDRRAVVVELTAELDAADVLTLAGLTDRAQVPQAMGEAKLTIEPPAWPSDRRGLVFLWRTDDGFNEVEDPSTGAARTCLVTPGGAAWLDRNYAMVLAGGAFRVDDESRNAVLEACRATSEITVEAVVTPAGRVRGAGRILTFSAGERQRNFTLGQEDDRLVFRLRTRTTGPNADQPQIDLAPVATGKPSHVAVTYTPGRLVAYVDGEKVYETEVIQSGFHHWKPRPFLIGNESRGVERPWRGTVEGVAVYNRFMSAEEAAENARRYAAAIAERPEVATVRLRARLSRRSRIPTLDEISPYREALAVFEYEVLEVIDGDYGSRAVRVVHRVLLDAERTPAARRAVGKEYTLLLEPFSANPQLEPLVLSDELPAVASTLFFEP